MSNPRRWDTVRFPLPPVKKPHATCSVCGHWRALRKDGTFQTHDRSAYPQGRYIRLHCKGSGILPVTNSEEK